MEARGSATGPTRASGSPLRHGSPSVLITITNTPTLTELTTDILSLFNRLRTFTLPKGRRRGRPGAVLLGRVDAERGATFTLLCNLQLATLLETIREAAPDRQRHGRRGGDELSREQVQGGPDQHPRGVIGRRVLPCPHQPRSCKAARRQSSCCRNTPRSRRPARAVGGRRGDPAGGPGQRVTATLRSATPPRTSCTGRYAT